MRQQYKIESLHICICELERQIHTQHLEMEELRRAGELRVDEFPSKRLRESHDTIQKLTSRIQDLQERANCMSDSREFQDAESICSGKSRTFSITRQLFRALVPCRAATNACDQKYQGNVFVNPSRRGALHSLSQNTTGRVPVQSGSGQPEAGSDERFGTVGPKQKKAVNNDFSPNSWDTTEFYGGDTRTSVRHPTRQRFNVGK